FSLFLSRTLLFSQTQNFGISYTLTEGGTKLELTPETNYRGVNVVVNSNAATQYEVIQRIVQPIQNRDNPNLTLGENLVVRGLRGTNQFGDFRIPTNDVPVRNEDRLYTSDSAGDSDNFTIVYGIINIDKIPAGYYQGQIAFVLRPINSNLNEQTQYLYVYVEVSQQAETKAATIEISGPLGSRAIELNPKKEGMQTADCLVKINGTFKENISLSHVLQRPLQSNEGNQAGPDIINVEVKAVKGLGINKPLPFAGISQDIYAADPRNQTDQDFVITYSLGDVSNLKAGRYTSRIVYYLAEGNNPPRPVGELDLELQIDRVFELVIAPQEQTSAIEFRNLKAGDEPRVSELDLEVKSNLGKPYQVTQNVYSDLTDPQGNTIPGKYFAMRTEGSADGTKGKLKVLEAQEVKKQDTIMFVSDSKGSPDKFKVIYELTIPEDIKAGNYATRITYSLVEL
ncbi:MAG: hypothetical protein HY761_04250, partial [Candidatus Omnitrophica bacterium]|nr:hypothetical protein [Candidatus Omnitrophota bacterium]